MRDSVLIYRSLYEAVKHLDPASYKEVLDAVFEYALNGTEPIPGGIGYAIFMMAKPQIDANNKKYMNRLSKTKDNTDEQAITNENKEEHRGTNENKQEQIGADQEQIGVINDKCEMINDINNNIKEREYRERKAQSRFTPPTLEEIKNYIAESGYAVDADRFFDYYSTSGWVLSNGNKMKDWKAAVRNWSRTQRQDVAAEAKKKTTQNRFHNFEQRTYDFSDLEKRLISAQG